MYRCLIVIICLFQCNIPKFNTNSENVFVQGKSLIKISFSIGKHYLATETGSSITLTHDLGIQHYFSKIRQHVSKITHLEGIKIQSSSHLPLFTIRKHAMRQLWTVEVVKSSEADSSSRATTGRQLRSSNGLGSGFPALQMNGITLYHTLKLWTIRSFLFLQASEIRVPIL